MRAFPDANILISYLLSPTGESPINTIIEGAVTGRYTLLVAEALFQEFIQRVATKPYLARRITNREVERLVTILLTVAETVPPITEAIPEVIRDRKDDYLLAYALVGGADYLVTGDADLLVLKEVGGLKIVPPRQFADLL